MLCALALAALGAGPCDLSSVVPGEYCRKCDRVLEKGESKAGKCPKDDEAVQKVAVCVKEDYQGCHRGPQGKPYWC